MVHLRTIYTLLVPPSPQPPNSSPYSALSSIMSCASSESNHSSPLFCSPSSSISSLSLSPTMERSYKDSVLSLTNWVTTLAFYLVTGRCDEQDVMMFLFSSSYDQIYQAVFEIIDSPYQTPYRLLHTLVFLQRFAEQSSQFDDLLEEDSEGAKMLCLVLRLCFIIAIEASEDQETEELTSLKFELAFAGFTNPQEYAIVRQNIYNTVSGNVQLDDDSWSRAIGLFTTITCDCAIPQEDIDNTSTIESFLALSSITSTVGNLPLSSLPLHYLSSSSHRGIPPPIARPALPSQKGSPQLSPPAEWNPAADPIVPIRSPRPEYVVPLMAPTLFRPKPVRIINVNLMEQEATHLGKGWMKALLWRSGPVPLLDGRICYF